MDFFHLGRGPRRLRLVAYLRLLQDEEEDSLRSQQAAIEDWARKEGHTVVAVQSDASGIYVEECVGLAKSLRLLADNAVDGVVVESFERLGPTLTLQECAFAEIFGLDGYLLTVREGLNQYGDEVDIDPVRHAFRQIVTSLFAFERALASSGFAAKVYRVLRLRDET